MVDAQLTLVVEPECLEDETVFKCEQATSPLRWTIKTVYRTFERVLSQDGEMLTFMDDLRYGFMMNRTATSDSIISFLRVNAVRDLSPAQVMCSGSTGAFMMMLEIGKAVLKLHELWIYVLCTVNSNSNFSQTKGTM